MAAPQTTPRTVHPSSQHNEPQHESSRASASSHEAAGTPTAKPPDFTNEEILTIIKLGTNSSFTWDDIAGIIMEVRRERIMQHLERGDLGTGLQLPIIPFTGAQVQEIVRQNREVYDAA
ncbi:MAG: hypothetical protein Q9174_002376, partial [Haloplaca sp. 1 TL-2023]